MKPKQNVQREINRTPDAFLRKRQLQIWKEKFSGKHSFK